MYYHEETLPLAIIAQALGLTPSMHPPAISIVELPPQFGMYDEFVKLSEAPAMIDPRLNQLARRRLRSDEVVNSIKTKRLPHVIEVKENAIGPGKQRNERVIKGGKSTPTSQSSFYSSESNETKIASVTNNELRDLQYDPESIDRWASVLSAPSVMLDVPPNALPLVPFPPNTSKEVEQELQDIVSVMNDKPLSNAITKKIDEDLLSIFFEICDKGGVDPMQEDAFFLSKDLFKIAIYLKYKFLRPRPSEIAPFYGFKLNADINLDGSNDTPSYPSNQSLQGYAMAKFYSDMYPQLKDRFYQAADAIALSRLQRGDHFPSDNAYSKMIADVLMGPSDQGQQPIPEPVKTKAQTQKDLLMSSVKSAPFSTTKPVRSQDMDMIDMEVDKQEQRQKTASLSRMKRFKHLDKLMGR